jgi:hypothetical protein
MIPRRPVGSGSLLTALYVERAHPGGSVRDRRNGERSRIGSSDAASSADRISQPDK